MKMKLSSFFIFLGFFAEISCLAVQNYTYCKEQRFASDSYVCVCTETYCDGFESDGRDLDKDEFGVYTSSKEGDHDRLRLVIGKRTPSWEQKVDKDTVVFKVNTNIKFQQVIGFGGAFTDAATINIKSLSSKLQGMLINSYFSPIGIEYNIGRIPMASCDFSTRIYTYDDTPGDFELKNFKLAPEDVDYKIPVIKMAIASSKREIKLFGSPWSAPAWMKNTNNTVGGVLIGDAGNKYHKSWAQYFVKFLDAYKQSGVKLWGVTVENEPFAGYVPNYKFQCMGFTGETERDFIKSDLGPALVSGGYQDVKLMVLDDNRLTIPKFPETILQDADAARYVSGVGVHWYEDFLIPATVLTELHDKFPDYFILATEACTGTGNFLQEGGPRLGDWGRGEKYSHSIIEDFQHWVTGWTDWNLALNMEGGPNWVKNFVDSPIIVDDKLHVFYKQPMFYHLAHFSKFVPPGSTRVDITTATPSDDLEYLAFLLPDGSKTVVLLNQGSKNYSVTFQTDGQGSVINGEIKASSIQTYVWV